MILITENKEDTLPFEKSIVNTMKGRSLSGWDIQTVTLIGELLLKTTVSIDHSTVKDTYRDIADHVLITFRNSFKPHVSKLQRIRREVITKIGEEERKGFFKDSE